MQSYDYRAIDPQGRIHKGRISAANELDLDLRVRKMHLELLSHRRSRNHGRKRFGLGGNRRRLLIDFVFSLEQLVRAGVPLLEGIHDVRDSLAASYFKDVLGNVIDAIEGGSTLSQALELHPELFDRVFISLIRVGEESGRLDTLLEQITESLKWQDELASHAKKIMIYPLILGSVLLGVTGFMMGYLVPRLVPFIREIGGELPPHTQALIATSDFIIANWPFLLGLLLGLPLAVRLARRLNRRFDYLISLLSLRFWLFGPLNLKIKLGRLAQSFSLMYSSGISVLEAMQLSESLVQNRVLEEKLRGARQQIAEGVGIAESYKRMDLFPPLVVRMLRVGESSGALDKALDNVSYFYTRDIRETIAKIEPAISPALTIAMAAIMGWVMVSVLGPIYDTIAKIG